MRAVDISKQEDLFKENLTNTNGVKYSLVSTIKLKNHSIEVIRPSFQNYFYHKETEKRKIVLHYTMGTLRGDMAALTKKNYHVSVSYVIARNGTIYELFHPKWWSYHLGKGAIGGNKAMSMDSVGIEISNYGPLKRVNSNLETYYSRREYTDKHGVKKKTKRDIYCAKTEKEYYNELEVPFRGYEYYSSFTHKQYDALYELLDYLNTMFRIPIVFLPTKKKFETFSSVSEARNYTGVCSHVNFRKSGKTDIGPAFGWDRIDPSLRVLMGATYDGETSFDSLPTNDFSEADSSEDDLINSAGVTGVVSRESDSLEDDLIYSSGMFADDIAIRTAGAIRTRDDISDSDVAKKICGSGYIISVPSPIPVVTPIISDKPPKPKRKNKFFKWLKNFFVKKKDQAKKRFGGVRFVW